MNLHQALARHIGSREEAEKIIELVKRFLEHNRGIEFDDTPETRKVIESLDTGLMP